MKTFLVAAIAMFTAGCSKSDAYVDIARDQARALEERVTVLSAVKDRASMDAARTALKRSHDRLEDLAQKARELPAPSAEVQTRLAEEWGGKLEATMRRLQEEASRIKALPGGEAFLQELDQAPGK